MLAPRTVVGAAKGGRDPLSAAASMTCKPSTLHEPLKRQISRSGIYEEVNSEEKCVRIDGKLSVSPDLAALWTERSCLSQLRSLMN